MTAPKPVDVERLRTDPVERFRFLQEFVGMTADDWSAIGESVAHLGPKLPAILDALYEHLLSFDDTRQIFLGDEGDLEPEYIELRKEHLTAWILQLATNKDQAAIARYLVSVGKRHTGVEGEAGRVVPPRYMVGLTGFVQNALLGTLFQVLPDDVPAALRMGLAWNKLLVVQLDVFLKQLAPHWPEWD